LVDDDVLLSDDHELDHEEFDDESVVVVLISSVGHELDHEELSDDVSSSADVVGVLSDDHEFDQLSVDVSSVVLFSLDHELLLLL
jgi:hypothetical protein